MNSTLPIVAIATRSSRSAIFLERVLDGIQKQTGAIFIWSIVTQQNLTPAHHSCIKRAQSFGITVIISYAHPNVSLGKLANIAINAVESDYIILHDDDDALNQDFIAPALTLFKKKSYVAVACHAAFIEERYDNLSLDFILSPGEKKVCLENLITDNLIVVHGLIYTRAVFNKLGGYDEQVKVAEDWLFNIKLCKFGVIAVWNRVCANVYLRKTEPNDSLIGHTSHQEHIRMKKLICTEEGWEENVQLEKRINTLTQKLRRHVDRMVFKLSRSFLPR